MDLLFGDTTENYDWLGVAVSGVVFAVILFLLRLYEEKKINK